MPDSEKKPQSSNHSVQRVQRFITLLSIALFALKLLAWILTHSVTILTDALESIVNVVASLIGLYSLRVAARPRDADHPYGHSKVEYISSGIEGALICIAGLLILYGAAMQFINPKEIHSLDSGIWIVAGSGLLNYLVGAYAVKTGRASRSLVVESAGKHLKSDAYSSVGVVVGLLLILLTNWLWLDSIVAAIFGVIILFTGYKVVRIALAGMMDEADLPLLQKILTALEANRRPQWIDLHNMRALMYGDKLHLDAHMTLPWYGLVQLADEETQALEAVVQKEFGNSAELFLHIDACQPYQCKLCRLSPCPVRQEAFKELVPWTLETVWEDSKHGKQNS